IAQAIEELETSTGLAEALLIVTNHQFEKWSNPETRQHAQPDRILRVLSYGGGDVSSPMAQVFRHFQEEVKKSDDVLVVFRKEFDPRQRRADEERKLVEFVTAHDTDNEVVEMRTFPTMDALLNPQNAQAVEFLRAVFGAHSNAPPDEVVRAARANFLDVMAKGIALGVSRTSEYRGKELRFKQEFLRVLQEERQTDAPVEAAAAFSNDAIMDLRKRVAERFSAYRAPTETTHDGYRYEPQESYRLGVSPMSSPQRIPDAAFVPDGVVALEGLTPLQGALTKFFRAARLLYDRRLAPETIQHDFGVDIGNNPNARQVLFDAIVRNAFFYDQERSLSERFSTMSDDEIRGMPEIFDYIRFSYQFMRSSEAYHSGVSEFMSYFTYGVIPRLRTPGEFAAQAERVHTAANHPGLRPLTEMGSMTSLEARRRLFTRVLQVLALKVDVRTASMQRREATKHTEEALVERAKAIGLPGEFFLKRPDAAAAGWLARALALVGMAKAEKGEPRDVERTMNRILSEEFMRLFAYNEEEMRLVKPGTIDLLQDG
ncbi:hypothetical protein HY634_02675, partial [Candidatus Uhrbacteria bacterium]|nr:hypothetical protein [Candidatus Uhrbacteria bacterium]